MHKNFSPKILFVSSRQKLFQAPKFFKQLLKPKQIKKHCLDASPSHAVKENFWMNGLAVLQKQRC